jgi:hypothetical protein
MPVAKQTLPPKSPSQALNAALTFALGRYDVSQGQEQRQLGKGQKTYKIWRREQGRRCSAGCGAFKQSIIAGFRSSSAANHFACATIQVLADSFQDRFKPFTVEKPRVCTS